MAELVETLLASPHYGERWGRYWLDLARYTDKIPDYLGNADAAWLYRDWVVRALNDDLPYDQFVTKQLAVDLLPGSQPEERHALGFLGLSPLYFKELQLPPEIIKTTVADEWEEHVDAIGRTFLGLTVACARCHDHKTDPITAQDYYGLAGVFASVRVAPIPALEATRWAPVAVARQEVTKLELARVELNKKKPAPADLATQVEALNLQIEAIKEETPDYSVPMANGVEDAALYVIAAANGKGTTLDYHLGQARDLEVQKRGNPNQTGEVVKRRFLSAFATKDGQPREFTQGRGPAGAGPRDPRRRAAARRARDRQSHLAASFRPRARGDAERVWHARRSAVASRAARRSRRALHRKRLVVQMAAPRDPPERRVAAGLPRAGLRAPRSGEQARRAHAAPPPRDRAVARRDARPPPACSTRNSAAPPSR